MLLTECAASRGAQPVGYFEYGVASGDFEADSIVIWTRVTPSEDGRSDPIVVDWFVSTDSNDFSNATHTGSVSTSASRDWTVCTRYRVSDHHHLSM